MSASDAYLRVVLLDTLTAGQRCAQAVHVAAAWGCSGGHEGAEVARLRVRVLTTYAAELARIAQALRDNGEFYAKFHEPEASSGGPGLTALAFRDGGPVVRVITRTLPSA